MIVNFNTDLLIKNIQKTSIARSSNSIRRNRTDSITFCANTNYAKTKNIWKTFEKSKNITILSHKDPDVDAISSGLLLLELLKTKFKDKKIQFLMSDTPPKFCSKISGINQIMDPKDSIIKDFDTVVVLDSDGTRVDCGEILKKANNKINIDHHISNNITNIFDDNLKVVQSDAVSTTQVLFDNFLMPFGIPVTSTMIECIMAGIVSDSGNFKHIHDKFLLNKTLTNIQRETKTPLELLVRKINQDFDSSNEVSAELEKLYQDELSKKLNTTNFETKNGTKVCCVVLARSVFEKNDIKDAEADIKAVLNRLVKHNVADADISVLIWERENGDAKLSFRSKDKDISVLAAKLGGGGHKLAAGATLQKPMCEAVLQAVSAIEELY